LTGGLLVLFPPVLVPAPHADFTVDVRRGGAPLDVAVESLSIGVIDRVEWEFGDGGRAGGPFAGHRYDKPGRYTVTLTVGGPGGSDVETKVDWIEVLDARLPVADFSVDPPKGRAPLAVRFTNRSKDAASFRWEFGDKTTSDEAEPTHTYAEPGSYTVILTAGNDFGRDVAAQRNAVKVVGPDAPLADFRGMPRKGPAPLEVAFEDLSEGPVTAWEWDFGDLSTPRENTSAERNPGYTYRWPGKYTVRLRVSGPGGQDMRVREKYIEVESEGDGGGGPGGGVQAAVPKGGASSAGGGGAGDQPGRLFEEPYQRPTVKLSPEAVPLEGEGDLVEKVKNVKLPGTGAGGDERPYTEVFGSYRRAAEDTMDREQIPPPLREYVKRYFERIRPK
jgi:PKD repeat protein